MSISFIFLSWLIALARTSSTMLRQSRDNEHPCLLPDFRQGGIHLFTINCNVIIFFLLLVLDLFYSSFANFSRSYLRLLTYFSYFLMYMFSTLISLSVLINCILQVLTCTIFILIWFCVFFKIYLDTSSLTNELFIIHVSWIIYNPYVIFNFRVFGNAPVSNNVVGF